ncbi:MAG: hypothetical protein D6790_10795 [Caldilineae bacterium]|nr:MAG: hypothetical protein D6790_10795 [Caldilineae bacterium]
MLMGVLMLATAGVMWWYGNADPEEGQAAIPIRVDVLEEEIAVRTGAERLALQRELVAMLKAEGAFERAARVQEEVARAVDTPAAWKEAGALYFNAMDQSSDKTRLAGRVIEAFERVLAHDPEDLDVRTDLAVACYLDPSRRHRAIEETRAVLRRDPGHLAAAFNLGIFLSQEGRADEAVPWFEQVAREGQPGSRLQREAARILRVLREHPGLPSGETTSE